VWRQLPSFPATPRLTKNREQFLPLTRLPLWDINFVSQALYSCMWISLPGMTPQFPVIGVAFQVSVCTKQGCVTRSFLGLESTIHKNNFELKASRIVTSDVRLPKPFLQSIYKASTCPSTSHHQQQLKQPTSSTIFFTFKHFHLLNQPKQPNFNQHGQSQGSRQQGHPPK
jgi:hypothetical protein